MDVVILGAMVVVLIAITVWVVVWPARATDSVDATARAEEDSPVMMPKGNEFEDQYTSATADLSAGGVATSLSGAEPALAETASVAADTRTELTPYQAAGEPWSEPTLAREGARYPVGIQPRLPAPSSSARTPGKAIGLGAAAALAVGSAAAGAWLYSRWRHERDKPINRLKRLF